MTKLLWGVTLIFLIASVPFSNCLAQKSYATSYKEQIDLTKVYDKETGKKISEEELGKLLRKNPNVRFDRVINESGEVIKYFYSPAKSSSRAPSTSGQVAVGDPFPKLVVKSENGQRLDLEKAKGKIVLLYFGLFADDYVHAKRDLKALENQVDSGEVVSQVFYVSSKGTKPDFSEAEFGVVVNGNFRRKFSINRTPTFVVIDRRGLVFSYSNSIDSVDLTIVPDLLPEEQNSGEAFIAEDAKKIMSIPFKREDPYRVRMDGPGSRTLTEADTSVLFIYKIGERKFDTSGQTAKEKSVMHLIDTNWVKDVSFERNLEEVHKIAPSWFEAIVEIEFKEEVWKEMPRKLKRQFRKQR